VASTLAAFRAALLLSALLLLAGAPGAAHAVSLAWVATTGNPASLTPGETLVVDLRISGLSAGAAPTLGAWDLTATFDPARLTFVGLGFGTALSAPGFPSLQLPVVSSPGQVQAAEAVTSCPAVEAIQPASFTVYTLTFTAGSAGSTQLGLLDDPPGNPFDLVDCTLPTPMEIVATPPTLDVVVQALEPGLTALLAAGLLGVAARRRPQRP
jgi:hypothetical protein